jgi:hypothetical protein
VGELTNMLGAGHILVQRYGDILDGKRTWPKGAGAVQRAPHAAGRRGRRHHRRHAVPRDDQHHQASSRHGQVVPGFASYETLLYSPELKFYSNKVKMDEDFNTSIKRPALPGRLLRLDPGADDGLRHGRAHGPPRRSAAALERSATSGTAHPRYRMTKTSGVCRAIRVVP